jgi:hypothetical protein
VRICVKRHKPSSKGATHLDDFGIDVALLLRPLENGLFYGASSCQHQHQHSLLLADAVRPVSRLLQGQGAALRGVSPTMQCCTIEAAWARCSRKLLQSQRLSHRSSAAVLTCKSICGFQSESNIRTCKEPWM